MLFTLDEVERMVKVKVLTVRINKEEATAILQWYDGNGTSAFSQAHPFYPIVKAVYEFAEAK